MESYCFFAAAAAAAEENKVADLSHVIIGPYTSGGKGAFSEERKGKKHGICMHIPTL